MIKEMVLEWAGIVEEVDDAMKDCTCSCNALVGYSPKDSRLALPSSLYNLAPPTLCSPPPDAPTPHPHSGPGED